MTLEEIYNKNNSSKEGILLKFRADRLPLGLSIGVLLVQLWAWYFLPVSSAAIVGLLLLVPLGSCAIYNHHQQHHGIFYADFLNRSWEVILGLQTMIGPYSWAIHHNYGHHPNYLNQPPCPGKNEDESRWARRDGSLMGRTEYTLNLLFRSAYDSILVGKRHPKVLRSLLLMHIPLLLVHLVLIWVNWQTYLAVFLLPSFIVLLYVYWLTYEHHAGLYTDNPYAGSRNRVGPVYNFRAFNLGYHTAHHLKPYIHWSLLPAYHELIKDKIPPECFVKCR
jgi:fatty acid desaturase